MTPLDNGASTYHSEILDEPGTRGVRHAFLGRYKDQKELNDIISGTFAADSTGVITIDQVHGNSVVLLDKPLKDSSYYKLIKGDAMVTALFNVPIAIRSADCLPILFYDDRSFTIGAAHAGWRSTLEGVAAKTIEAMTKEFGSDPKNIRAAFGPYIGPCCYTVEPHMLNKFERAGLNIDSFIISNNSTRLDLALANIDQLINAGLNIENISGKAPCTSCSNDTYYSYRAGGKETGRQLSIIMMRRAH